MVLMLDEDDSFSISANVTSPGPQRTILQGYLVSRRSDGVYVAPLIPQLFYGASGSQLQTWRQNITTTGNQVIISRVAGGLPNVPKQELYWRKVQDPQTAEVTSQVSKPLETDYTSLITALVGLIAGIVVIGGLYVLAKK